MEIFEDRVGANPNIVEAQRLFGSPDHLLKVIAVDLPAYQRFDDAELTSLPGVERLTSTLVMKNLNSNAGPPVQAVANGVPGWSCQASVSYSRSSPVVRYGMTSRRNMLVEVRTIPGQSLISSDTR
jgi:hypothetical protein